MKKKLLIALLAITATLCCVFGLTACAKEEDTYYNIGYNGEVDSETYFVLKSGKWTDDENKSGTYKKDGDKIVFYSTFFGQTVELGDGTLKDHVLTLNGETYISEKHKHKYGEWETTIEPTETTDGIQIETCILCGQKEANVLSALGLKGLKYELSADNKSYYVAGIGALIGTEKIVIPSTYQDKPVTKIGTNAFRGCDGVTSITIPYSVTSIGSSAFYGCNGLTSITIPYSVTSIDSSAFYGCNGLTSIIIPDHITKISEYVFEYCGGLTSITIPYSVTLIGYQALFGCGELVNINFKGTKAQWEAISKGGRWNEDTGNYTVHCTDGDIAKKGS